MSELGLGAINSTQNQSNSVLRPLEERVNYIQIALLVPACVQLFLCAIATVAIVRVRALRTGQNLYIVNLILSDVLRAILGVWVFTFSVRGYELDDTQEASNACVSFYFFWHWQFFWSMWGTVLISQSRYSTLKDPFADGVTTRKAAIASAITFAIGIVIAVPPLFTWAKYALKVYVAPSGYYRLVCTVDRSDPAKILSFVVFYYGLSYWVPFVIVIYYLVQTLRIVVRSMIERRQLTALPAVTVNAKTTVQFPTSVIKSKALWYVIAVVVSNALLPAPYIVVQILRGARVVLPDKLFVATGFIFHFNFLANSAFYCFWAKTLTRSLWDVLRCRRLHNAS